MRDFFNLLPGVLSHDFIEAFANLENFPGMDVYFRRLSLESA